MQPIRCRFIAFFTLTLYFTGSVLAGVVTGTVTGVLDGDTLEVLHHEHPERIRLNGIDCPEKGQAYGKREKQASSELVFGKKSPFKPTVSTSMAARSLMCCCPMAPTSITHWSNTAGAGGIERMRQGIRGLKAWGRTHERPGYGCGLIRSRSHRGSLGPLLAS